MRLVTSIIIMASLVGAIYALEIVLEALLV
jgi:hypothetical protein